MMATLPSIKDQPLRILGRILTGLGGDVELVLADSMHVRFLGRNTLELEWEQLVAPNGTAQFRRQLTIEEMP